MDPLKIVARATRERCRCLSVTLVEAIQRTLEQSGTALLSAEQMVVTRARMAMLLEEVAEAKATLTPNRSQVAQAKKELEDEAAREAARLLVESADNPNPSE